MPSFGLRRHNLVYKGKPRKRMSKPVKSKKKHVAVDSGKLLKDLGLDGIRELHFCNSCEL